MRACAMVLRDETSLRYVRDPRFGEGRAGDNLPPPILSGRAFCQSTIFPYFWKAEGSKWGVVFQGIDAHEMA